MAFLVFSVSNLVLTLFASVITALICPQAAGSGIPEVKAYLNGVDAPGILSPRTLLVKVKKFLIHSFLSLRNIINCSVLPLNFTPTLVKTGCLV